MLTRAYRQILRSLLIIPIFPIQMTTEAGAGSSELSAHDVVIRSSKAATPRKEPTPPLSPSKTTNEVPRFHAWEEILMRLDKGWAVKPRLASPLRET
ncbi:hypothetical protein F4778DRAFT_785463 [Xylariomycetidae sp. FL2044]|nr:hypothetical protein F4778DRAFT_785463 [Xylariomycetidae sp. FL2044]